MTLPTSKHIDKSIVEEVFINMKYLQSENILLMKVLRQEY
jgi:hypothetical protein